MCVQVYVNTCTHAAVSVYIYACVFVCIRYSLNVLFQTALYLKGCSDWLSYKSEKVISSMDNCALLAVGLEYLMV